MKLKHGHRTTKTEKFEALITAKNNQRKEKLIIQCNFGVEVGTVAILRDKAEEKRYIKGRQKIRLRTQWYEYTFTLDGEKWIGHLKRKLNTK